MSKRALVTGGSGEIGSAICHELAAAGFEVIVHGYQRAERARAVVEAIRAKGGAAEAVCFDVTNAEETSRVLEGLKTTGTIQVLVNNAGMYHDAVMAGMTVEQWRSVIDVSLNGFFHVTQPLLLPMIQSRWGRIVNITSISGLIGNRGQVNYAAAKAGLHGATKALAVELASRGITVNAVAPGVIATLGTEELFTPEAVARLVPMKRAGAPFEVASLVAYLASEAAAYVSGQIISINGAMA
ncbi:3-ketoacyl-ACP reductase [Nitrospira sp. KM1]|uniref:3-oxoacyl-ACP reductase FabG n=1 Tax=Nitrospira sp. KM1 TaxID=1936990 RepID=UPI0013A76D06|nr:3-oxoacyl-ACP reductase FabG [Nitrospira sp. KM1]BCA55722.1 3-ketoacyl-ACP reductase [Nitrospira sp. KM1]